MTDRPGMSRSRRIGELVWGLALAGCLAFGLGRPALIDPDEGRNAAIAQQMARSGDFLVPHLNGAPFLDKPPLFFAAEAVAMRVLGSSELAARLPSLLFAWATVALTAWFCLQLFGRSSAWIAGTAVATAPLAMAMARTAIFDTMLSFFMVLALCAFYRAVESQSEGESALSWRPWTLLGWAAIALGVLTKGPVALLVPLLVAGSYALWRRRSIAVWHPSGWFLFLLLVLPWALFVERRVPGFLRYALLTETWSRLTTDQLQRTGPIWYFLPYLLVGFFPWIFVAAAAVVRGRRQGSALPPRLKRALVFLALWIALPLLLFSLSQSKRPQYILPLVPAVALLAAWAWSRSAPPWREVRIAATGWILVGIALLAAPSSRRWLELDGDVASAARLPLLTVGVVATACGVLSFRQARRRGLAPVLLSLPVLALGVLSPLAMSEIARGRSSEALATAIKPHLTARTRVVEIDTFSPSLAFYLRRATLLSTSTPALMGSNFIARFAATPALRDTPLRPVGWWRQALADCAQPTIFVFRERYRGERSALAAAGLPVLFESRGLLAMGPCGEPAVGAAATAAVGVAASAR